MSRPFRKDFTIELDRVRTFRLTWKECSAFEVERMKAYQAPRMSFMKFLMRANEWDVEELLLLLWCGLRHEEPEITQEQLALMCDLGTVYDFQAKLMELLMDVMPEDAKKNVRELLASLQSPLGTSSSPLPPESVSSPPSSGP